MGDATFTFRVDETLKNEFVSAAKARDRTSAELLRDFMRAFVSQQIQSAARESSLRAEVQKGLDAANAGDVISSKEVEAEARAWRARTRRKVGAS